MAGRKKHWFADDFKPDFGMKWVPPWPRSVLETLPMDQLLRYEEARKYAEKMSEENPVMGGWILPSWKVVMDNWTKYPIHVLLGGNRSGKSTLASRLAVWAACTIPEAEVRAYHVSEERSIEQQRFIWEAIPQSIKNLPTKKGQNHSLQYSQKNGFTDNICIFPPIAGYKRGGYIKFGNYKQYQQDAQIAEGFKSHLLWLDEEAPQKFFETLIYRTSDYHGRIILTFTTLNGWTPLVQDLLGKTKTLDKRHAELVNRDLPILQESLSRPGSLIHYFWTQDNAFIDTKDFLDKIKSRPRDEIMARAYGVPTKAISSAFPAFNKDVHVIPHSEMPWIKNPEYPVTRYMAIDPGDAKNWFIVWVAVDAAGTWWVYREWPDYDDWALPGNTVEGKPGPAQKCSRSGVRDYVEMIRDAEKQNDETIFERFIDPRMSATERHTVEGASTILSDLDECDMTVIPAPGVDITNGLQKIRNKLAWDENQPRSSTNAPHFYISDRCVNTIYALQEYTARGGSTEATKDPIDVLRYLAVSNVEFYENTKIDVSDQTGCY